MQKCYQLSWTLFPWGWLPLDLDTDPTCKPTRKRQEHVRQSKATFCSYRMNGYCSGNLQCGSSIHRSGWPGDYILQEVIFSLACTTPLDYPREKWRTTLSQKRHNSQLKKWQEPSRKETETNDKRSGKFRHDPLSLLKFSTWTNLSSSGHSCW